METLTINACECIDIFIASSDPGTLPPNAIVSGYFEVRFIDLSNGVQFADEEVVLHGGE